MSKTKNLLIISNEIFDSQQEELSYSSEKDFSFYQKPSRMNSKKTHTKKFKKSKKDDHEYD